MGAASEWWRVVAMTEQFRVGRIAQIVNGEAAVAPCRKAEISGADEMMQRCPFAERSGGDLVTGAVHTGQPPATRQLRSRWIRSEEHTSELQSMTHIVCRPLLAKNKT